MKKFMTGLGLAAVAAVLVACGGGGSGSAATTTPVTTAMVSGKFVDATLAVWATNAARPRR